VIERDGLEEFADVVDHQRAGQALEHGLVLRQIAAVELQLHVPAERRNPGGHCFENFPRQGRARQHEEADTPGAKLGQPVKLKIRHAFIDNNDATRV